MSKKSMTIQKKTGLLSSAITVVVAVCLVLLNVAAMALTEHYPVKLDLTANKVFALSQESIDYIGGLSEPVKLTVLNTKSNFTGAGEYYKQALSVLEQYAQYSGQITVEYVDLLLNPNYTAQYPDIELLLNDILVQSADRMEKLSAQDLFNIEAGYFGFGGTITSSNAEQAMTSAILNVTSVDKPLAVFLTGHEETDVSMVQNLLTKNGYEVAQTAPLTESIPAEADLVFLSAPQRDLMDEELQRLDDYLAGAEKKLLYFASAQQPPLPNLEGWLAKWGIAVDGGSVIESDPSRIVGADNPFFGLAQMDDSTLAAMMRNPTTPLAVPYARPVMRIFESSMGYQTRTLLSYAATAGILPAGAQTMEEIVGTGQPISVAAISERAEDGSKLLVFGSDLMLAQSLMESGALSNADYFLSVCNTLSEREDIVSIAPKVIGGGSFAVSQIQVLLYALFFVILLPLVVLIVGIAIWTRRRAR